MNQKFVIDPLAVAVILDCHGRVGGKLKHCLCTLLGYVRDDDSIAVVDAYANHVVEAENHMILPGKTHHDLTLQSLQKVNPRLIALGWGTTDIPLENMDHIISWARSDIRSSKFVSQKRLKSPLILMVDYPTSQTPFSAKVYKKVTSESGGSLQEVPFSLRQARPGLDLSAFLDPDLGRPTSESINYIADSTKEMKQLVIDRLIERIDRVKAYVDGVLAGKQKADVQFARTLCAAISPAVSICREASTRKDTEDKLYMTLLDSMSQLTGMLVKRFAIAGQI